MQFIFTVLINWTSDKLDNVRLYRKYILSAKTPSLNREVEKNKFVIRTGYLDNVVNASLMSI